MSVQDDFDQEKNLIYRAMSHYRRKLRATLSNPALAGYHSMYEDELERVQAWLDRQNVDELDEAE